MDDIDLAAERVEVLNAAAIQAVLGKVETVPSTGICRACGEGIEADRLKANPYARHCRDCADEAEARAKMARRCGPR
ncbi:MAG: TraR/DksA C4-type zinc finger protein [Phaeospirillum sp.]|nr:TraR/DksA C4-type zinc finger protein [Phaeospirillum sp.]